MRLYSLIVLCLFCLVPSVFALEISAVFPSTVTPGAVVTITGGPFSGGATILVGPRRIGVDTLSASRLTFTVPPLAPGAYAMAVEQQGERSTGNFVLRVVQPPPRIARLSPADLDTCATGSERQVTVEGSDFQPGAALLVDGTAVVLDKSDASALVFTLPAVKPGLHQVQAVNPDSQRSLPHALLLNSTPELATVQSGESRVLDYDLILTGRNFLFDSILTVNGTAVSRATVTAATAPAVEGSAGIQRDQVRYVDCTTLIYTRHPFIREAQELSLLVINPGGEQSNVYQITTP